MAGPFTEHVLVVPRADVFPDGAWHGFVDAGLELYRQIFRERSFFMPRAEVEEDPGYQQIIPYVVFRHGDRYLLTRRLKASSEKRLRQLYSLGVGGHINPGDLSNGDPVLDGLRREWEEEVEYEGHFQARLLGLINDDSSPVSRVHLGLVFDWTVEDNGRSTKQLVYGCPKQSLNKNVRCTCNEASQHNGHP